MLAARCVVMCFCSLALTAQDTLLLQRVRARVLEFSNLPDFVCTETIHRYSAPSDLAARLRGWQTTDKIVAEVTYSNGHEQYRVLRASDKSESSKTLDDLGGTTSRGEFATLLREIAASDTQFGPPRRTRFRRRDVVVFPYEVDQQRSRFRVGVDNRLSEFAGYHGDLSVDAATEAVLHVTQVAEKVFDSFGIKSVRTSLDYGTVRIADREYWLPTRAEVVTDHVSFQTSNIIQFQGYRKFSVDSRVE